MIYRSSYCCGSLSVTISLLVHVYIIICAFGFIFIYKPKISFLFFLTHSLSLPFFLSFKMYVDSFIRRIPSTYVHLINLLSYIGWVCQYSRTYREKITNNCPCTWIYTVLYLFGRLNTRRATFIIVFFDFVPIK